MEMTREYLTRSAHEVRDAFLKTQEDPTASVVNMRGQMTLMASKYVDCVKLLTWPLSAI